MGRSQPEAVPKKGKFSTENVNFQAIAEYTYDWESWFGTDGILRWVNSAVERITGYQVHECMSMHEYPLPMVHQDDKGLVAKHIENAMAEELDFDIEFRLKCKNGIIRWASLSYQPVYDEVETLIGTRWSVRDINVQKQNEQKVKMAMTQAELANRAKTELVTNMSHELRTPLNAIIGFSEAVKEETFGAINNEKYLEYINCIHASGEHLLELINDILDVAAIEAGKLELNIEEVNIGYLMEACLRLVRPRADEAGVQIHNEIGLGMPLLKVDERRVKQIFLNILSNAVKFTDRGGEVNIGVWLDEKNDMVINVADTGIGMDEEGLAKSMIFFGQADSHLARKYEGTGLGLPLSKNLVDIHGGQLKIKSQKGLGTSVKICFPASRVIQQE
ncbi:MAG: PAS domain-containing protein [Rhodospirillales bacterium]|nr:PAS domain-containing protein [Rhodospirillales bacterium]